MPIDEASLATKYDLIVLSVLSSTKIEQRASSIISNFSATPDPASKPVIFSLTAKARTASKLISIVEIAKRELTTRSISVVQYNALTSQIIQIPREPAKKSVLQHRIDVNGEIEGVIEDADGDDDGAFETMGAPPTSTHKSRDVPVMTIYLSREEVKVLAEQFGTEIMKAIRRIIS